MQRTVAQGPRAASIFSKEGSLVNDPDSHSVVVEQLVVEPKVETPDDMRVSSEEVSTALRFIAERSQKPILLPIFPKRSEL